MTGIAVRGDFVDRATDALYTDALLLSDETRGYFDGEGRAERDRLDPQGRVQFACEALKATTRLLLVIAWLSAARQLAGHGHPLGRASASEPDTLGRLPSTARKLILAGIDLHERTGRIAEGTDAPIANASPARALIQRLERAFGALQDCNFRRRVPC